MLPSPPRRGVRPPHGVSRVIARGGDRDERRFLAGFARLGGATERGVGACHSRQDDSRDADRLTARQKRVRCNPEPEETSVPALASSLTDRDDEERPVLRNWQGEGWPR